MGERAAFAVKERFDEDSLGTVFVSDAGDLNVREAIASGENYGAAGVIVTEDPAEIAALDRYEPLKRTTLQEADAEKKRPQQRGAQASSTAGGER